MHYTRILHNVKGSEEKNFMVLLKTVKVIATWISEILKSESLHVLLFHVIL